MFWPSKLGSVGRLCIGSLSCLHHQSAPEYKVGDKVWLNLQNYSTDHPMKKLDDKWAGPFTITKVISPTAVKLQLTAWEKNIHPVMSVSVTHPYISDEIAEGPQPLQPGSADNDEDRAYEVEDILDSKFRWRKLWYLAKFFGLHKLRQHVAFPWRPG